MRKSTKLKIFRRKKRSVILSVLKRHSLRQHTKTDCAGRCGGSEENGSGEGIPVSEGKDGEAVRL